MFTYEIEKLDDKYVAKIINIVDNHVVLYQPFNPQTGEDFKTYEEAEDYIKNEIKSYNSSTITDTFNSLNKDGFIENGIKSVVEEYKLTNILQDVERKLLMIETIFKYNLNIDVSEITSIINKEINNTFKKQENYKIDINALSYKIKEKYKLDNDTINKFKEVCEDIVSNYIKAKYIQFVYTFIQSDKFKNKMLVEKYSINDVEDEADIISIIKKAIDDLFIVDEVIKDAKV